jgi:hypothetical protein
MRRASLARIYIVTTMILVFLFVALPAYFNRNRMIYKNLKGIHLVVPEAVWKEKELKTEHSGHSIYARSRAKSVVIWGVELSEAREGKDPLPFHISDRKVYRGMDADEVVECLKKEALVYHDVESEVKEDRGPVQLRSIVSTEMTRKGPCRLYSVVYVKGDYIYWQGILLRNFEINEEMQEKIRQEILKQ